MIYFIVVMLPYAYNLGVG